MSLARRLIIAAILIGLAACTAASPDPLDSIDPLDPDDPVIEQPGPIAIERMDLRAHLGHDDVDAVGVSIDPVTGQLVLLDQTRGIYAIYADSAELLVDWNDLPEPDVPLQSQFTDLAVLGNNHIALTARNDGYVLDLDAGSLRQHFCYVPDGGPFDEDIEQLTLSLTYHRERDRLYAQPQTFLLDGQLVSAEIGEFDRQTGVDLRWFFLPDVDFVAGGIAVDHQGGLVLGRDSTIYRFDTERDVDVQPGIDLAEHGVEAITGLAVDWTSSSLLVLDGASQSIISVPLVDLD